MNIDWIEQQVPHWSMPSRHKFHLVKGEEEEDHMLEEEEESHTEVEEAALQVQMEEATVIQVNFQAEVKDEN